MTKRELLEKLKDVSDDAVIYAHECGAPHDWIVHHVAINPKDKGERVYLQNRSNREHRGRRGR